MITFDSDPIPFEILRLRLESVRRGVPALELSPRIARTTYGHALLARHHRERQGRVVAGQGGLRRGSGADDRCRDGSVSGR